MSVRVRPAIAVLLSRFPLITETFILREVMELERQGQPVVLVPMIRENPDVVHEEAKPWVGRAVFTPWFSLEIAKAMFRAFTRKPGVIFRLLLWIIGGSIFSPGTFFRSLFLFPKSVYLAERLREMGVAHLHAHFATHPTTMATIISALSGIPFSFTVHAHDIFVDRALLARKLDDAAFIRSISAFNLRFLERLYPREATGKIRVVHVGIDPEHYRPEARVKPHETLRILCIAALKPYKGVGFLVDACKILLESGRAFRCDIIGVGPMRNAIRRRIVHGHLHDRVRMRGALPQHLVAEEVRRADIFVLPSIIAADGQMEGIPVALMEAMAAEKPVVTTALSGVPELVENGVSGILVDPANPRSLADAIERLIASPELCATLGKAARKKVEVEFDVRACVTELLAIFDEIVAPVDSATAGVIATIADTGGTYGLRHARRGPDAAVYEITSAHQDPPNWIVKEHLSRKGESRDPVTRAEHEYNMLARLSEHFAGTQHLGVPRPIALRGSTVAMARADGFALTDIVRAARRGGDVASLRSALQKTGSWLHHFQEFESADHDHAIIAIDTIVDRALIDARLAGIGSRIRRRVEELRSELSQRPRLAVAHHGDFWPGNVFVGHDGSIGVIDFEGYGLSLPSHDINYFLLHISLYYAARGRHLMETVRESFFDGYEQALDPAELELCRLATALQLAARDDRHMRVAQRVVRRKVLRKELSR